jgi:hypothetical protein
MGGNSISSPERIVMARVSAEQHLLEVLHTRFENNLHRHAGVAWADVFKRLDGNAAALASLRDMEATGGEPDVVGIADPSGSMAFFDCAPESPPGRRSLCYDVAAHAARKENRPAGSAVGTAAAMGITLLDEAQYRALQALGEFDLKTSSWILTPPAIRALGGALFCDRRYGTVFTYHNGVQSYYAGRGFRGALRL